MARQYQIPGGPFVDITEDGQEYALPGYGYINEATVSGAATIDLNPQAWTWEAIPTEIKEQIELSPTVFEWQTVSLEIKENIDLSPQFWTWETVTGDIQEGATTTIDLNPQAWVWDTVSGSINQTLDLSPQEWVWQTISMEIKEQIDLVPQAWTWETVSGSILGTETIDLVLNAWQWETVSGSIIYVQPEVSETIGGKPNKYIKWPFYDNETYESKIDLDETIRNDNRPVSDLLNDIGNVIRGIDTDHGKPVELVTRPIEQNGELVSDLVARITPKIEQVSIEFPQVEESEGFDEEAAVIMLLLAA